MTNPSKLSPMRNTLLALAAGAAILAPDVASAQFQELPQEFLAAYPYPRNSTFELKNAEQLRYHLEINSHVQTAQIATSAAQTFYHTWFGYLDGFLGSPLFQYIAKRLDPADQAAIVTALRGTGLEVEVGDAVKSMLEYQSATTPNHISSFVIEAKGTVRRFLPLSPGRPETAFTQIRKDYYYPLIFTVKLASPGTGANKIKTLEYISRRITDLLLDKIPKTIRDSLPSKDTDDLYVFVKSGIRSGLLSVASAIASGAVNPLAFHMRSDWATTDSFELQFGPEDLDPPISIGDSRVVRIAEYNREFLTYADRNFSLFVQGIKGGTATLIGAFTPAFARIGQALPNTERMAFLVADPAEKPVPEIVTRPTGALPPERSMSPSRSEPFVIHLFPAVRPDGAKPAPSPPSGVPTGFEPCIQLPDGAWKDPARCEPH